MHKLFFDCVFKAVQHFGQTPVLKHFDGTTPYSLLKKMQCHTFPGDYDFLEGSIALYAGFCKEKCKRQKEMRPSILTMREKIDKIIKRKLCL